MASPGTVNISAADQKDLEKVRIIKGCWAQIQLAVFIHTKHNSLFFLVYKVPGRQGSASGGSGAPGWASDGPQVSRFELI